MNYLLNFGAMINEYTRLAAACRRLQFELTKALGIFWILDNSSWLKIKEPWNTLYQRSKRKP